ncbi:MAG: phosphotransferase [Bacillota bacterium]
MSKRKVRQEREMLEPGSWDLVEILREWDLPVRKIRNTKYGYKIKTNWGYRMLKRSLYEDRVVFMHQVLEHIAHDGYRQNIPRLIPTKYGDAFVRHGFHVYYLTDWFDGKEFKVKNPDHIYAAAESLGEIHQVAKKFVPKNKEAARERWNELSERMAADNFFIQHNIETLPAEFSQAWTHLKESAKEALARLGNEEFARLKKWSMSEGTLCHREFTPANLMVENCPVAIRWEHCALGVQVADLANYMHKVMPHYHWDYTLGEGILESYNSMRKLTEDELFVLGALLMYPKDFVKLMKKYERGRVVRNKLPAKIQKILNKEKEKAAFLDAFFEMYNLHQAKTYQSQPTIVAKMWYCLPGHIDLSNLDKRGISCLLPLSYTIDEQGNLEGEVNQEISSIAREKEIPLCPVMYSAGFSKGQRQVIQVLAKEDAREKLTDSILKVLKENNYPGVNIIIDLWDAENTASFNCFIEILAEKLRLEDRLLLVNVSAPKEENIFDYHFLGRFADYVLVELLDENLRFPGSVVSRDFVNAAMEYLASYIPASKIVGVLPVYGYRWWVGKNIRQSLSYDEANRLAVCAKTLLERDPVSGSLSAKLRLKEECEVWAEDAISIKEKELLVRDNGAAGCAFWRLGLEDPLLFQVSEHEEVEFAESFSEEEDSPEEE